MLDESAVDQLDVYATILDCLACVGDLHQPAGGDVGIGELALVNEFHGHRIARSGEGEPSLVLTAHRLSQTSAALADPGSRSTFVGQRTDNRAQITYSPAEQREAGMGRFYFHLRSGEKVLTDEEGSDFSDIAAARLEALTAARQILADAIRYGRDDIPEAFIIADSGGREVETLPLALVLPIGLRSKVYRSLASFRRPQ